jgi:hypothetical protein
LRFVEARPRASTWESKKQRRKASCGRKYVSVEIKKTVPDIGKSLRVYPGQPNPGGHTLAVFLGLAGTY